MPLNATRSASRSRDLWAVEHLLAAEGLVHIAGVDEAGRGPLAGPVVTAAVILPPDCALRGLNDSKQVAPHARERLAQEIQAAAVAWAVEVVPPAVIDTLNILGATLAGMRAALTALSTRPQVALVDGNQRIPDCPVPHLMLVKGDALSANIAAASILAKVHRDHLMLALDAAYPGYGFAQHKGYPTAAHFAALDRLGPCPAHRRSFAPVQARAQQSLTLDW